MQYTLNKYLFHCINKQTSVINISKNKYGFIFVNRILCATRVLFGLLEESNFGYLVFDYGPNVGQLSENNV